MHRLRTVTYLDVSAVAGHHAMPAALLFLLSMPWALPVSICLCMHSFILDVFIILRQCVANKGDNIHFLVSELYALAKKSSFRVITPEPYGIHS